MHAPASRPATTSSHFGLIGQAVAAPSLGLAARSLLWFARKRIESNAAAISAPNELPANLTREPGRDLDIIAENGSVIAHCPLVAARFGDGLESFKTYRKRGLRIGLGTDTSPPDMLLNMQTGLMVCRFVEGEAQACRAEDYFDAATLGGADALGRADLGRLAPSCRADMVVWDLSNPDLGQVIDPIQTLMISGSGRDARTVVIDGRMVMRDREIPTMDYAAETARAQRQFNTLMAKYPERTLGNPPTDEIFSSAYRVIPRAP
ncbi:MAG: hypothetical protein E5W19_14920 [Mesorhizobium sp.]|nr:MAG: hypothetical protein E5W19_14920 [Mesorhizobium sp.]